MSHFKNFLRGFLAQGFEPDSQDQIPSSYVVTPLRNLIDALELFEALKRDGKCWVELGLDFVAYDCISVNFFTQDDEQDRSSEPEQGEAGEGEDEPLQLPMQATSIPPPIRGID